MCLSCKKKNVVNDKWKGRALPLLKVREICVLSGWHWLGIAGTDTCWSSSLSAHPYMDYVCTLNLLVIFLSPYRWCWIHVLCYLCYAIKLIVPGSQGFIPLVTRNTMWKEHWGGHTACLRLFITMAEQKTASPALWAPELLNAAGAFQRGEQLGLFQCELCTRTLCFSQQKLSKPPAEKAWPGSRERRLLWNWSPLLWNTATVASAVAPPGVSWPENR